VIFVKKEKRLEELNYYLTIRPFDSNVDLRGVAIFATIATLVALAVLAIVIFKLF
jgi:hypothetical protein